METYGRESNGIFFCVWTPSSTNPDVTTVVPDTGAWGTPVRINGSGFAPVAADNEVLTDAVVAQAFGFGDAPTATPSHQFIDLAPTVLDRRSRAEARAGVSAAEAALEAAETRVRAAEAEAELAESERERIEQERLVAAANTRIKVALDNVGSAVILPEVFLKALTVARNLGHHLAHFTTVNLDFIRHYRPMTNVVQRPTINGGQGINLVGHHEIMLPLIATGVIEQINA